MGRIIVKRIRRGTPAAHSTAGMQPRRVRVMNSEALSGFNPAILGLGDISLPSRETEAIAVVFDLAKFTTFCNQVDPHLEVPKYLSHFLEWLFGKIRNKLTEADFGDHKTLWSEPPFLAKYLGDGVLFLWNADNLTETQACRIVTINYEITRAYRYEFFPKISMLVDRPPSVLRCGMARGRVFSVGNGRDYFGHCINTAARLQKLSLLTFCFPHRGFNVRNYMGESERANFIPRRVSIRGVGDNELVWVVREEFEELPDRSKELFKAP